MQIHEVTKKNNDSLNEGVGSALGGMAGSVVSGLGKVGSAVASPFKDVAQGYKTARADSTVRLLADKLMRAWQQYMVQWAKSQGGTYTLPGSGNTPSAPQTPAAQAQGAQTPAAQAKPTPGQQTVDMEKIFNTVQSLDDKQLKAIYTILSQRVGPQATMNALKAPEPGAVNEVSYQGIKDVAKGVATAAQTAYQKAAPVAKKVATAGMQAVKSAPKTLATTAGNVAGAVAGMPGAANTAYRTNKQRVSGPSMTTGELNMAVSRLTVQQAEQLLAFVNQIQTGRKAGLREGISDNIPTDKYQEILKAFVQKNLFTGMQYSQIQNVGDIDKLIGDIVNPANDTMSKQKELWNKLTLAASVAQRKAAPGATSGATNEPTSTASTGQASGETAEQLMGPLRDSLEALGQDKNAKTIGQLIRQNFTNNNSTVQSSGVPAVDAMLRSMGFNPS
jgi:hypothetical protein